MALMKDRMRDLGLSYMAAAHGIQSAIAHKLAGGWNGADPKHARTGIDLSKSDHLGLATLLVDKGVFTMEEYLEHMRLAANDELARFEEEINRISDVKLSFR